MLPCWSYGEGIVRLKRYMEVHDYRIVGVLLFENRHNAFFLVWGMKPSANRTDVANMFNGVSEVKAWWTQCEGYFCALVEWEHLMGAPYESATATSLVAAWRREDGKFYKDLVRYCQQHLVGRDMNPEHNLVIHGGENMSTTVAASVSPQTFLGVNGLTVDVAIAKIR